jgi:hypothetical protein
MTRSPIALITTNGQPMHDTAGEMAEKIMAVIYDEFSGRNIPLALTLGVLRVVEHQLIEDASK